jgi:phospholipase C
MCEHPEAAGLEYGEFLVAGLLDALTSNPEVWAKTVFLITYDENDGFFDHVPSALPAVSAQMGGSTISIEGEVLRGEPVGLGIRVPMLVVSPWSKGGWVNSQVFDHTSVLRFLEARFGVAEPNISPWRRTVTGDLTSAFDFRHPDPAAAVDLPSPTGSAGHVAEGRRMLRPVPPGKQTMPVQEPGQRPARALPYALSVEERLSADGQLSLTFRNQGAAGAVFLVSGTEAGEGPWHYTVGSGQQLAGAWPPDMHEGYDLEVHAPNGFFRAYRSGPGANAPRLSVHERGSASAGFSLRVVNHDTVAHRVRVESAHTYDTPSHEFDLGPAEQREVAFPIARTDHW